MLIAITGGASLLGQALARHWQHTHQIRTVDSITLPPGSNSHNHHIGDIRDPAFARKTVSDAKILVHLDPIYSTRTNELDRLDGASRGTYQLFLAAAAASVQTIVLGSTMELFTAYPSDWQVTEQWAPRPMTTSNHLAPYLVESSARELARELPLRVLCLRFGRIVGETDVAGCRFDGLWLHMDDAVHAIEQAAGVRMGGCSQTKGWFPYHILAAGPRTRFPLVGARCEPFGYAPKHDFRDCWPENFIHASATPRPPAVRSRTIRRVVVFGAGGPLAAAAAPPLAPVTVMPNI